MPKAKITKIFVEQVPLTEKGQVLYCDTELRGFYVIVGMQAKTYVAQKDIRGRTIRCTIGRHGHFTAEQARKIAKEKLYQMANGVDPNVEADKERTKSVTLGDALESYLENRLNLKPRTIEDYRYYIDKYAPDWKDALLTSITKEMVGKRHRAIAKNNGIYPANKVMRVVRALFNFAHATYDICPVNPVIYLTHVRGWAKETRRRTYIKPHDLKKWWQAVQALENDTYRDFFLLMLFTGLRKGEAQKLRWDDIDFRDKTFIVADTKNGDPLTLPLGNFLLAMLEDRRKRYGNYEYVFPSTGATGYLHEPKKGQQKVIKQSGVQFTNHDLRRTFITIAESLEISAYALKRLINHRATDVTGGYIIVDVERLRSPVNKIEAFILEKVTT
ncbi:MAG: tyrosine-type recombinase/integrase [Gammaproteobacteria bacterium]|nr:tyrosine-type recombinase/integrase [Gammaproteobacteria bacterium]